MDVQVKWKLYAVIVILLKIVMVQCQSVEEKGVNKSMKNQTNAIPQSSTDVIFTSEWARDSSTFRRPDATRTGNFYYQAVLITVPKTGVYTIRSESSVNSIGYLYSPSFDKRKPKQDLIDSDDDSAGNWQFQIRRTLTLNQRYYLVVTTYLPSGTGSFTIIVSGLKEVDVIPITSPFGFVKILNSDLNYFSPTFKRPNGPSGDNFYSVIRVTVQTTGDYSFQSTSSMDAYGLLYYPKFNETSPSSNLIAYDDDSAGGAQFYITHRLVADTPYFLVVTSFSQGVIAAFTVNATGPGPFDLVEITNEISLVHSTLSSKLTRNDSKYSGLFSGSSNYYYKLFQIIPKNSGYYQFKSESAISSAVFLYQNTFSPVQTSSNLITYAFDYPGAPFSPFFQYLQTGTKYYLVVSTFQQNTIGRFTIRISGRTAVRFVNVSTSQSATNNVLSSLTESSRRFRRPFGDGNYYYYRTFRVTVPMTGLYTIYTSGNVDTFGFIYQSSFIATSPEQNIIAYNDQTGGKNQFELGVLLNRDTTYFLVVTTYREYTFGSFRINIRGPARATMVVRN